MKAARERRFKVRRLLHFSHVGFISETFPVLSWINLSQVNTRMVHRACWVICVVRDK